VLQETSDDARLVERVAALDIGKAEVVCCVRAIDRIRSHDKPPASAATLAADTGTVRRAMSRAHRHKSRLRSG
jgi:transposase